MGIDTVSDLPRRDQYVASASQTEFDFTFPIFVDADLVVDVDGTVQALNVAYTVAGAGADLGGTITFATPLSGNEIVTLYSDLAIERTTDFQQNGPWTSQDTNDELDRLTLICRELADKIGRCIRWPFVASQTSAGLELSPISSWYSKVLRISSAGLLEAADLISDVVALSADVIGIWINPLSDAEVSAGVTPTHYRFRVGNPRRYNATGDGVADDTAPVLNALAVIKASYVNARTQALEWELEPNDQYVVTSPIHFGSTTANGGRVVNFRGNGAKFICNHTGIGVDRTNWESGVCHDLRVTNGTAIPKILVLDCRFADSTSQGMRHKDYNLRVEGRASICGLFNYGSESNSYYSPRVLMDTDTPFGHIISDTGRYWDGAAFVDVVPFIPNMNGADPVLPGVSTTNLGFHDYWNSHTTTYANGGRAALQFVGSGKHAFGGTCFVDTGDTAVRPIMSVSDTGVGGDQVHSIDIPDFNPHTPNVICWEHVSGPIKWIRFKNINIGVPTTADFQLTAGTLVACEIEGHKIVLNSTAGGSNKFTVDTSFSASGTIEGHIYLSDGATVSLAGNNSQKRVAIHDSDTGRTYTGWDVREVDTVSTSGTGEDNLKTYELTGATTFLGAAGRHLQVRAAGTKTGGAGNKTLKFYIGTTSWTFHAAANNTNNWALEADIYTTGSATQTVFLKAYEAGALTYAAQVSAAENLAVTKTMKITGECANGADAVTQTLWVVEKE